MTLTGRFVLLVALGVVPIVLLGDTSARALAVLAGWLLLALTLGIIDLALAASPRRLTLARVLPSRVRLGEEVTSELYLRNDGPRRLRGIVRDGWQPSAGAGNNRTAVTLPAGERRLVELTLVPTRRGERTASHVTVRSMGPLGLWARQATLIAPAQIRVLPPFHSRKHLPSRISRLKELDGRTSVLVRGQGTEFDSLREYVRGDDVRSIDWRATARRNDVVVRTWRPERDRRIVIVIDTGRTSAARVADEPRLDTAFEAALLLAALASRAGDRVDFLAWDRRVRARVQGASGAELLSRMVDGMALIEPELIEMDWTALPGQIRGITGQHALVVLLTPMDAPGASTGLLSVLGQLTSRHTVLVASVTDPSVAGLTRSRGTREDVYRAASAERTLLDATRVAAAVRQLGADVVTGAPDELPPALADRYIALKAAGRL
ncbi:MULTISPECIES: DUF58 domain-containing protein [unclassified Cryobacterium]|uniref:DUF58 domain-containing protein n=1 Tax=unclassified Cryobacterium TaxID=2649013 RepID=UPI00106B6EE7|nr:MULTISPECIES: DUF58 domain-containing protein [unclassified Cryobacterium]TFC51739.1 DUF58 domain-containing protein [Cryobacterium sp. TMB3-1-2]TFC60305.1 DUF58 domain-containing protein [Cryobacterium sp. TMB1-7]TFC68910.1 DUF58 domain-containing protein [Cryobacterium sp. TMB3-15]TFC72236.1 DUF58 domain-containing protein [Cryobacterium sp. TMB3-10]TFD39299.1 DUF58 domain-containing protein [Cryobacterium sp. TMB3-12]